MELKIEAPQTSHSNPLLQSILTLRAELRLLKKRFLAELRAQEDSATASEQGRHLEQSDVASSSTASCPPQLHSCGNEQHNSISSPETSAETCPQGQTVPGRNSLETIHPVTSNQGTSQHSRGTNAPEDLREHDLCGTQQAEEQSQLFSTVPAASSDGFVAIEMACQTELDLNLNPALDSLNPSIVRRSDAACQVVLEELGAYDASGKRGLMHEEHDALEVAEVRDSSRQTDLQRNIDVASHIKLPQVQLPSCLCAHPTFGMVCVSSSHTSFCFGASVVRVCFFVRMALFRFHLNLIWVPERVPYHRSTVAAQTMLLPPSSPAPFAGPWC